MQNEKSAGLAAVLGFLFGGFGLFYVSVGQGVTALIALVVISIVTGGIGAPFMWLACGFWGYAAANKHNEQSRLYLEQEDEIDSYYRGAPAPRQVQNQVPNNHNQGWQPAYTPTQQSGRQPTHPPVAVGQFCDQCGTPIRGNAKFCRSCGAHV